MSHPVTVRLGDVASFVRGITFKPDDVVTVGAADAVACMRTKNVQAELDLSDVWGIPESFVKREDQYLMPGDLLVSTANSWNLVGKCCWVPDLQWRATFGGFISVLRGDGARIEPRYLYHWFSSPQVQATVRSFGQQTTNISNLNVGRCLRLPLPLPPLSEQRRIAEILDKADWLRAKRRAALAKLDTLTQSVFLDMFGDPARNPKGWPVDGLGQLADTTSGGTPRRDVDEYFGGRIPWVKSGELHGGVVTATEETLTERGLVESSAKLMRPGTVLVAMYGATVGAVAVLGIEAATNQAVCCITPSGILRADYLVFLLRRLTPSLLAKRVGGAQPNLSQDLLRKLIVPVPPRQLQDLFAGRVAAATATTRTAVRSLDEMDALFVSLQQRAFRGEL